VEEDDASSSYGKEAVQYDKVDVAAVKEVISGFGV